ncbi:MAG: response regulator [Spirochaetales bacterium]|nr:response regulator [Spirochaetales bacterium]
MGREIDTEILIVDDNIDNLNVLRGVLKNDYKIRIATNGIEALASINEALPDLILLDVHLPKLSGFEVCSKLKKQEKTKKIPVIFLSALQDSYNRLQAFKLGAVDYIAKPFEMAEVMARVKIHMYYSFLEKEVNRLNRRLIENQLEIL